MGVVGLERAMHAAGVVGNGKTHPRLSTLALCRATGRHKQGFDAETPGAPRDIVQAGGRGEGGGGRRGIKDSRDH